MFSPSVKSSPTYKNLKIKQKHSPVELKEKMRNDYKHKIRNCRNILLDKFREQGEEYIQESFKEIYENVKSKIDLDDDENDFLKVIKDELIQEEYQWWLEEYEKSQIEGTDWSILESDEEVICPVCQKCNLILSKNTISCNICDHNVKTELSLADIKENIMNSVDNHSKLCDLEPHFTLLTELTHTHIYLICEQCNDMRIVV